MAQAKRPYMKYLIAGGVVTSEGGPCLVAGLEFAMITRMIGSTFLTAITAVLIVIGVVSICIGLSLLYKGVNERNLWLQAHPTELSRLEPEVPLEQRPAQMQQPIANEGRRFCAYCGSPLPAILNMKFCQVCGKPI
jgi:hypothetical protein